MHRARAELSHFERLEREVEKPVLAGPGAARHRDHVLDRRVFASYLHDLLGRGLHRRKRGVLRPLDLPEDGAVVLQGKKPFGTILNR